MNVDARSGDTPKQPLLAHVVREPLDEFLPGLGPRTTLIFDDEGFTWKYPFGTSRYGWQEIEGEFNVSGGRVVFNLTPEALSRRNIAARSVYRFQRVVSGSDAAMKALVFGKSSAELAGMLNRQRTLRMQHAGT